MRANPTVKLGDTLTAAQRAKVIKPILWYEYRVVDGKRVLVPELIIPEKDRARYASVTGGMVEADDIYIEGDRVTNTGTLLATKTLSIKAGEFLNERRVAVAAGGLPGEKAIQSGGLISGKVVLIDTKRDLVNRGGAILGKDAVQLKAGGHIRIEAQEVVNSYFAGNKKSWSITSDARHYGGLVSSGGDLVIKAEKTVSILGSAVTAKKDALVVGKEGITVASVLDEHDVTAGGKKSGLLSRSSFGYTSAASVNVSSVVSAGRNLTLRTERGDITIAASHLSAGKDLAVAAGYDENGDPIKGARASVNILSGQDGHDTAFMQKKSGVGLFATGGGVDVYRSSQTALTTSERRNVSSSLTAGGDIDVLAARDITIKGSVVAGKGQVNVHAERDTLIVPGSDETAFAYSRKDKGLGLRFGAGDGGLSASAGYHASSRFASESASTVAPSIIHGGKGISVLGGRHVTIAGAEITSRGHINLDADKGDLTISAGTGRATSYASSKDVFAGISVKVNQSVSGALDQLRQAPGTFASGHGGGVYRAIGAASGVMQGVDALSQLSRAHVSASATVGASGSHSSSASWSETAVPTRIAGGSVKLHSGRNMRLTGVNADSKGAFDIHAGRDLLVESAQSSSGSSASAKSWHAGVGLYGSAGVGGVSGGVGAEAGASGRSSRSGSVEHVNSHLTAGGKMTIKTGRDATVAGAVVKADSMGLEIGRNLTVSSRQDKSHASGSSWNLSGTVGPGGLSGSRSGDLPAGAPTTRSPRR